MQVMIPRNTRERKRKLAAVSQATLEFVIICELNGSAGSVSHLRPKMQRDWACRWYYREQSLVLANSWRHRCLDQSCGFRDSRVTKMQSAGQQKKAPGSAVRSEALRRKASL